MLGGYGWWVNGLNRSSPRTETLNRLDRVHVIAKRAVAPRWRWLTLVALAIFVMCVRLSIWQFDRLAERTAALATASTRAERSPVALDAPGLYGELIALAPADLATYEMRRASVRGTFDHEHDQALTMQVVDGRLGVRLLSPLRIAGGAGAVLVDRGWLPIDYDRPDKWFPFRIVGQVAIEGRLRPGFRRTRAGATVDDAGLVPDLDLDQIAASLPYQIVRLVLVESPPIGVTAADSLPVKRELEVAPAQVPHLAYAVQWLAFALIVAGGYVGLVASDPGTRARAPRVRAAIEQ